MSATTGAKPANPAAARAPKPPPEGVEKSLKASLQDVMGVAAATCTADDMARVDKFFTTPMAEHEGFQKKQCSLSYPAYSLPLCLMTKKKKPVATFYMFDEGEKTKESGVLVLALRGDRKLENISLVEADEKLMGALKQSVFVVYPDNPCNFHPWYSSILSSFSDKCTEAYQTVSGANVTAGVKDAIAKNRIMVAIVPPSPVAIESVYHKLAIDVAPAAMTSEKLAAHKSEWFNESKAPNKLVDPPQVWDWFNSITSQAKEFAPCKPQAAAPKATPAPAPALAPAPAAPKRAAVIDDDDDDMLEAAPAKQPEKPASNKGPVAAAAANDDDDDDDDDEPVEKPKKSKKDKRDGRYKRGGQSKFIADTIVSSRKEDEREEREERVFNKKLNKYKDTDDESDLSSDSDSGKKRKKRRRKECSNSESEMSDDYSDSDEEESDEDSDEESSSEEESATSSDEEEPPLKKKRLVKAADAVKDGMKQTKLNLVSADHPVVAAPEATEGSSDQAMPDVVDAEEPAEKKKASVRTAPARENREGVAATIKLMLDAVEGCVGIPLTMTEKINLLVSDLREGFKEYESEKFPIKQTYRLHTHHAKLTMAIITALNASMTTEQRNNDANASRRLAVSTTSALMSIVPSLDEVDSSIRESVKVIEELKKMTAAIAEDMKKSASTINEE